MSRKSQFTKYKLKDRMEIDIQPPPKSKSGSYGPIPTLDIETIRNEFFTKVESPNLTGDGSKWDTYFAGSPVPTRRFSMAAAAARINRYREGRIEVDQERNDPYDVPEWLDPSRTPSMRGGPEITRPSFSARKGSEMLSPRAQVPAGYANVWTEAPPRRASEASWRDPFAQNRMKTPPGFVSYTAPNFSRKPSEATWRDPFQNSSQPPTPVQSYSQPPTPGQSYGSWAADAANRNVSVSSFYSQYAPDPLARKASTWKDPFHGSRMPDLEEHPTYDSGASHQNDVQPVFADPFEAPLIASPAGLAPPTKYKDRKATLVGWEEPAQAPLVEKPYEDHSQKWDHSTLRERMDDLSDYATSTFSSVRKPRPYSYYQEPDLKHKKVKRVRKSWYGGWSTRQIILIATGMILTTAAALGIGIGLWQNKLDDYDGLTPIWRPAIGTTMQLQIGSVVTNPSRRAIVYDIDLFDNNATTISQLHKMGRRVICYFSAGTYENWRSDASQFAASTLGNNVTLWPGEKWLDTRQTSVRTIMTNRIALAQSKGCDGIDPDNVDGYVSNVTGFALTVNDAADYVRFLASQAHAVGLAIGLKNAPELINKTLDVLEWQLNESCAKNNECALFQPFIEAGKPVFHVEYASNATVSVLKAACNAPGTHLFSTMIKKSSLDTWAVDCPFGDPTYGLD